jgi:hypothetical protein
MPVSVNGCNALYMRGRIACPGSPFAWTRATGLRPPRVRRNSLCVPAVRPEASQVQHAIDLCVSCRPMMCPRGLILRSWPGRCETTSSAAWAKGHLVLPVAQAAAPGALGPADSGASPMVIRLYQCARTTPAIREEIRNSPFACAPSPAGTGSTGPRSASGRRGTRSRIACTGRTNSMPR